MFLYLLLLLNYNGNYRNWYPIAKSDNLKYEGLKLIEEGHKLATKICLQKIPEYLIKKENEEYKKVLSYILIKC